MNIDRAATIKLLPDDGTPWGEWVDRAAKLLIERGYLRWVEDPLELAIHAGLMCRDVRLKSGEPLPVIPSPDWLQELMRTQNERKGYCGTTPAKMPAKAPAAPAKVITWRDHHEGDLDLVMEAHRRLEKETGDSRTAAALVLAWATLEAGSRTFSS